MRTSSPFPPLAHPTTQLLPAGTTLWHQHQYKKNPTTGAFDFPADGFAPDSQFRFSGRSASAPRAMFYAGSTISCALWETVLRNNYGNATKLTVVSTATLAQRRVTPLRTMRDLQLLDLTPGPLRQSAGSETVHSAWQQLTVTPQHAETHAPIAQLLDAIATPHIDGVVWHSRQAGNANSRPLAFALFSPPVFSIDFGPLAPDLTVDLDDTPAGWTAIDRALREAGLIRFGVPATSPLGTL